MPATEFTYRVQVNDRFVGSILVAKKQVLIDKNNVFSMNAA